ncbi:MAG: hypothetical protein ACLFV3_00050 [Phycisphaeraceae bacterium]
MAKRRSILYLGIMRNCGNMTWSTLGLLVLALLAGGCEEEGIRVQRVPKAAAPATAPARPASQPAPAEPASMSWTLPDGWREVDDDQPMRVATFMAGPEGEALEVAVSAFAGDAGGTRANINRWRRQMGLGPIEAGEIDEHTSAFQHDDLRGRTLRIRGRASQDEPATDMLAAILQAGGSRTWFVRATGPADLLDRHESAFEQFAHSFRPAATAPADHHDHDHDHADHAPPDAQPSWQVPAGWQPEEAASRFVHAAFTAGPADRPASVRVTPMPGDGGGLEANLRMWRQQVGLPAEGADSENLRAASIEVAGQPVTLVELRGGAGEGASAGALIVAVMPRDHQTWFLRIAGPDSTVDEERDEFIRFVQSVRFGEN